MCQLYKVICSGRNIELDYMGNCKRPGRPCPVFKCPQTNDPVCGTDGRTYSKSINSSMAVDFSKYWCQFK